MTFLPHRIRYYGFWRCFCHENYLRYTRPQDGIPKRIINYIITHMKYMYHSCEKDIQIFLSSKHIVDANPSQWFPTFRESTLPHTHRYIYIYIASCIYARFLGHANSDVWPSHRSHSAAKFYKIPSDLSEKQETSSSMWAFKPSILRRDSFSFPVGKNGFTCCKWLDITAGKKTL